MLRHDIPTKLALAAGHCCHDAVNRTWEVDATSKLFQGIIFALDTVSVSSLGIGVLVPQLALQPSCH